MSEPAKRARSKSFGSIRERPSGKWEARYRDRDGMQRSMMHPTAKDARAFLSSTQSAMLKGEWIAPEASSITCAEWADRFMQSKRKIRPRTREIYEWMIRCHLNPAFGKRKLKNIGPAEVDDWMTAMVEDGSLKPSSLTSTLRLFRQIMQKAVRERRILHNPCDGIETPRHVPEEMMFLTELQVADLATAVGEMCQPHKGVEPNPAWRCMVALAAYGGLRWGEVTGLGIKGVDPLRSRVRVTQQLHRDGTLDEPKSPRSVRWVSLPRWLSDELAAAIAMREPADDLPGHHRDLVFLTRDGTAMQHSTSWRRNVWKPSVEKALPPELHGLRFHDLRHTAVAIAIESARQAGRPLNAKALQDRMGHSTITMTLDRYGHLVEGHDDDMVQAMANPFERPSLRVV